MNECQVCGEPTNRKPYRSFLGKEVTSCRLCYGTGADSVIAYTSYDSWAFPIQVMMRLGNTLLKEIRKGRKR